MNGLLPLVGVVVGALLGGAAQIVAGYLSDQRVHHQWLRDQRLAAYRAILERADELIRKLEKEERIGGLEYPIDELFDGGFPSLLTPVELFGTTSVTEAARGVLHAAVGFADSYPGEDLHSKIKGFNEARDTYLAAVRQDLNAS